MSAVCWHDGSISRGHRCGPAHDDAGLYSYGRCRSGSRWFWAVTCYEWAASGRPGLHGWAPDEGAALVEARAAVERAAAGRPAVATLRHGEASSALRRLNGAKHAARPASADTSAGVVEYLYGLHHHASDDWAIPDTWEVVPFRITRKTARRVYYVRREGWEPARDPARLGVVDRQALEHGGQVTIRARGWWEPDQTLYASRDLAEAHLPGRAPDPAPGALRRLRQEMADAHPDRGGSNEGFIAARRRYERALREAS